ncbi:hypothetical protein N431DRAFT_357093 [Stipitochalara longipes BDJ]|nr:hypothetical protein N431DRAFT_357093 [Stipitochalara longipes BDJ]
MGRLESLTALALGRGHYEEEVIINPEAEPPPGANPQQYNDRGYPRNPETKRQEREHVRAANEVMQVTGVVEDSHAASQKYLQSKIDKNQETITGLRLMEAGRAVFVGGVWGVLGLRKRILLYKPYSEIGILGIMRREASTYSIPHPFVAGLPAVLAYHVCDWVAIFSESIIEGVFLADEDGLLTEQQFRVGQYIQNVFDFGFCFVCTHLRMFAILQQLNLVPASWLLPSFRSFIPFSRASPLQLPPIPSLGISSLGSFAGSLLWTAAPMLMVLAHSKFKYMVGRIMYRPIYKILPRPSGDSMFSGLEMTTPMMEYDTPDQPVGERSRNRTEDEPTLRALEGRPALDRTETRIRQTEREHDTSDDEEEELTQATLISFDVEATDVVESSLGTWSAELRSANEPKASQVLRYHITGLTMLPPIMATEGLRQIVTGIIVMPLETLMVRVIGRAYRTSAGMEMDDMFIWGIPSLGNIVAALAVQLVVTGVIWTGYTAGAQWLAARWRSERAGK